MPGDVYSMCVWHKERNRFETNLYTQHCKISTCIIKRCQDEPVSISSLFHFPPNFIPNSFPKWPEKSLNLVDFHVSSKYMCLSDDNGTVYISISV